MTLIRRVVIKKFGDESQIALVNSDIADPGPKEAQVRVEYSALSGADINMRKGIFPFQKKAPFTPGYSIVGKVSANGGRSRYNVGDRIACLTRYGGQAELINVPEQFLVPVPDNADPQQAVALVVDWLTAYQMLIRSTTVRRGQKVFIHGLSGGVGRGLLELAKLEGAEVYGTASVKNHPELRKLGVTPYAYSDKNWIAVVQGFGGVDVVFDALGFTSFDESYSILRRGGVLVGYGFNLLNLTKAKHRPFVPEMLRLLSKNLRLWTHKRTRFYGISRTSKYYLSDLNTLLGMLADGKIAVPIKAVYGLGQVPDAHKAWANSVGVGTIVIDVQH